MKTIKKHARITLLSFFIAIMVFPVSPAEARVAFPILAIVRAAVVKAIKAADLAIQRQQNKVIWLQNAQKVIENAMSKLKLKEIGEWTQKQREQYQKYYDELWKVKNAISYYQRIREITANQIRLVEEYDRAWSIISKDKHFSIDEIDYMGKVYAGILEESIKNIDQIILVVNAFKTQMSDAKRLEIINAAAARVDENFDDLRRFNRENALLSLSRAKHQNDVEVTKSIYGIK